MNRTRQILGPLALAVVFVMGCAQPPSEQLADAEKAVSDARQSGAATYAADEYAKLEGTLVALKQEVGEQDGKFALFRDYGKAEQLAVTAKADAERIRTDAAKKKAEAKAAAEQAQQVAQEAVRAAVELVAQAPVGKDRAALEAIKNETEALKASLNQVQMAIDKEDYPTAQAQAKAIHDKSQAVSAEIQQALAKVGNKGTPSTARKR